MEVVVNAKEALVSLTEVNAKLTELGARAEATGVKLSALEKTTAVAGAAFKVASVAAAAFSVIAVESATKAEEAYARLDTALKNTGNGSAATNEEMKKLSESNTKLGFTTEATAGALGTLVTATGNTHDATKLLNTAMDLARYKHVDLSSAATILARGTQGSAKAFKEMGITLDASLPKQQAINKAMNELNAKLSGQSQAYLKTFGGQVQVLSAQFQLTAEKVGELLIPILLKMGQVIASIVGWIEKNANALKALAAVVIAAGLIWKSYEITLVAVNAVQKIQIALALASAEGIGKIKAAQLLLNDAMKANQIGLIITGLTIAAGLFIALWNHSELFRKGVVTAIQVVINAVGYLVGALGSLVTGMSHIPIIGKMFKGTSDFINNAANDIRKFGDGLDKLKDKKVTVKKEETSTSSKDPFNLKNYSGATKVAKDALTPLYDDVQKTYDKMTKVISDEADSQAQLVQDAFDREAAAQKNYDDTVFSLNRTHNEDLFKLNRDYADKKFGLQRTYQDSISAAEKNFNDSRTKAFQKAEDDKLAIIRKSISLLTSAFSSATGIDIGSIFAASFTKDNALANTLINQVKNGVTTVVSWWGTAGKQGVDGLLKDLTEKLNSAKTLSSNAAKLAAQGYSQTFIQQIVSQGSDIGNQMANAILSASPEAQSQLKDLYSQIQDVSENGVTALATQMNSGGKLATKELTDAYAQVTTELNTTLKDISASFQEAQDGANRKLREGLADAEKTYNDAIYDMNQKLKDGLFDANANLQDAIKASQKQFNSDVDKLQKDTIDKLKTLQDELKATADKIKVISGASTAVSVMASSPAAPYLSGVTPITPSITSPTPMGLQQGVVAGVTGGIVIKQTNNINGQTTPQDITTATVSAIKFGSVGSIGMRYAQSQAFL
jgi:hypothetical protein